jgi:hypothetical protein
MSVIYSGSQLAVIGTEHTIADITTPGSYIYKVNATPMLTGDVLELRVKGKVIAAGALVGDQKKTLSDAQGADTAHWVSRPFRVDTGLDARCTLKQLSGTGRTYEVSISRIDS